MCKKGDDFIKFEEIVAPSIRELFVQRLQTMILSGELRPGDRLPTERELADEMKISKTAVHEGITELHRLGFVEVAQRKGVVVADYALNGNIDTLMAIMRFNGGRMDPDTAHSLLELRWFIEGLSFRLLAAHHTEDDIAVLQQRLEAVLAVPHTDHTALAEMFFQFHRTVVFLSGNKLSPIIFNAFKTIGLIFWQDYFRINGVDACLEQLEKFFICIRDNRGEEADRMLESGLVAYDNYLHNKPGCRKPWL